ncbi:RluA family pseudouridine synthase [Mucilaginibacter terrae]|uniref:tRNA pseudouridine32 synthase/23S rRNA pseudouridine746 synthase n=1 Tax=Mucilaginibacter terrae TaxID=1955052 RepID=A0ABU3GX27_9SPHI|nr:RluA family pseudouridine synthase [Mucilaginibacter terrae]MDT3404325.1 tRNA pseudouridine32 synthase/23S rRNA pseudouridine746 synthase [Mucilaginibacter terrae]
MGINSQNKITYFTAEQIKDIALPERFTYPFYYEPHPLTHIAASELQHYLETQTNLDHNFGLDADMDGAEIGKMFGVLVVQDTAGKVGYLSAFSGKLAGANEHPMFVPPVFDMLVEGSFFLQGQQVINHINARVDEILADEHYRHLQQDLKLFIIQSQQEVNSFKKQLKDNKASRKKLRQEQMAVLNEADYAAFEALMIKQSLRDKHQLNVLTQQWDLRLAEVKTAMTAYEDSIELLKNERRERSAALQQQLFDQYVFLNKNGKSKSLHDIFSATVYQKPPSAAGECATPKLLQYAFINGYQPLAMAEFWWGAAPKSDIRQHKQFYPACTGKCKPILGHMLQGMQVDENPLLQNPGESTKLDIIYDDEFFVVVNKPAELRSVPGVNIADSVYTRLKAILNGTEPLMVHRLDMGTSGLLVVAKTPEAHKNIQRQFLKRTVSKRYTALLSKALTQTEGEIDLPLRPDLYNRPRQLVCLENGKKSVTRWMVIQVTESTTKIHFWPLTGRTHQLRMHAAHEMGLNAPIIGDDLYGTPAKRLYLHAAYLEFVHPHTRQKVSFEVTEDF